MGQPLRSRSAPAASRPTPLPTNFVWNSIFRDIKPLRLLLMLMSVLAFAAAVPVEAQTVGLMTPLYRALPGVFKE